MYNFIKLLAIVLLGIVILQFASCGRDVKTTEITNSETTSGTVERENSINLNNFNLTLPKNWTKRVTEKEIFFDDNNKKAVGGISLVGYYGNYNGTLPNHSETLSMEDINTPLGQGKLFTLKRSSPATESNPETWNEIHAVIPANKNNLAYDVWVKGTKDTLLDILQSMY